MAKANSESNTTHQRLSAKLVAFLVFASISVLLIIGTIIPLAMSDGTEKYSGAEKQAAVAQLNSVKSLTGMAEQALDGIISYRVENVFKTPNDKIQSWCGSGSTGKDMYYSVTVSERTFFGIVLSEVTRHDTCVLL